MKSSNRRKKIKHLARIFLTFWIVFIAASALVYLPQFRLTQVRTARADTIILDIAGDGTCGDNCWTVPGDWDPNANRIEVIGGGAGGKNGGNSGSGGGGGGAYSSAENVALTANVNVTFAIGTGGAENLNGGDTYICNAVDAVNCVALTGSAVVVGAQRGQAPTGAGVSGGAGGDSTAGKAVGTNPLKYSGGAGGAGDSTGDVGGGGGGAAGPGGGGGAGESTDGTTGIDGGGGGGGGGDGAGNAAEAGGIDSDGFGGDGPSGLGGGAAANAAGTANTGGGGAGDDGGVGNGGAGGTGDGSVATGSGWGTGIGAGGGGGGVPGNAAGDVGGPGGNYGGGGGGGENGGGAGAGGIIVITYTPAAATLTQNNFWFYEDNNLADPVDIWGVPDLTENSPLNAIPATNQAPTSTEEVRIRMNFTVASTLSADSVTLKLQYATSTVGSLDCSSETAGNFKDVEANGTTAAWYFAASGVADGASITPTLTGSDTGKYAKTNTVTNPAATDTQDVEFDWHIQHNAADAQTYCFRMVKSTGDLDAYNSDSYPRITTAPGAGNLLRHGNFFDQAGEKGFFWAD